MEESEGTSSVVKLILSEAPSERLLARWLASPERSVITRFRFGSLTPRHADKAGDAEQRR